MYIENGKSNISRLLLRKHSTLISRKNCVLHLVDFFQFTVITLSIIDRAFVPDLLLEVVWVPIYWLWHYFLLVFHMPFIFLQLLKSPIDLVCLRQVIGGFVASVHDVRVRMVLSKTYNIPLLKIIWTHWAVVYSWDISQEVVSHTCHLVKDADFFMVKSIPNYESICAQHIHTHSQYIGIGRENCYIRLNDRKAYILLFWAEIAWIFFYNIPQYLKAFCHKLIIFSLKQGNYFKILGGILISSRMNISFSLPLIRSSFVIGIRLIMNVGWLV